MILVPDRDFTCQAAAGFYLCTGRTTTAQELFSRLHKVTAASTRAIALAQGVPAADLPDSFGPSLVAAVQTVLNTLNKTVPLPDILRPIFDRRASDELLVAYTASRTALILDYVNRVLTLYPYALAVRPQPVVPPPTLRGSGWSKTRILSIGGAAAAVGGLAFLAVKVQRRISGQEDGSHFLPDDEYEDDSDAEGDESSNVIDVEAVEKKEEAEA